MVPVHIRVVNTACPPTATTLHRPFKASWINQSAEIHRCRNSTYRQHWQWGQNFYPEKINLLGFKQSDIYLCFTSKWKYWSLPRVLVTKVWIPRARDLSSGVMHLQVQNKTNQENKEYIIKNKPVTVGWQVSIAAMDRREVIQRMQEQTLARLNFRGIIGELSCSFCLILLFNAGH